MSSKLDENLPNLHGAPHHVRPQSRGGTGKFADLFYWPGVAKNRISHKHSAFHTLYSNATLLEVVQRLPAFEDRHGVLRVDFLTASHDKKPVTSAWKTLYGDSDVLPWDAFLYLLSLYGVDRFRKHVSEQLNGRSVVEMLAREKEYIQFFLTEPKTVKKNLVRSTEEWAAIYGPWRRIVGTTNFFQSILLLAALETYDRTLSVSYLTRTNKSGSPKTKKKQVMLSAWGELFGDRNATPWEAAQHMKKIFGIERIRKNILWQLDGRSVDAFAKRQCAYFDVFME